MTICHVIVALFGKGLLNVVEKGKIMQGMVDRFLKLKHFDRPVGKLGQRSQRTPERFSFLNTKGAFWVGREKLTAPAQGWDKEELLLPSGHMGKGGAAFYLTIFKGIPIQSVQSAHKKQTVKF